LPVSDKYKITVEAGGFKAPACTALVLQVGQSRRVDFQLQLGNTSEKIEAMADLHVADYPLLLRSDAAPSALESSEEE
jgi:hypothetical protein